MARGTIQKLQPQASGTLTHNNWNKNKQYTYFEVSILIELELQHLLMILKVLTSRIVTDLIRKMLRIWKLLNYSCMRACMRNLILQCVTVAAACSLRSHPFIFYMRLCPMEDEWGMKFWFVASLWSLYIFSAHSIILIYCILSDAVTVWTIRSCFVI